MSHRVGCGAYLNIANIKAFVLLLLPYSEDKGEKINNVCWLVGWFLFMMLLLLLLKRSLGTFRIIMMSLHTVYLA